jgi:two-component system cell cycle response regulator DivK
MGLKMFGSWRKPAPPEPEQSPFEVANSPAAAKTVTLPIGRGRKILVVDDNDVVLKAFQLKLESLGFTVLTTSEGATAVSIARQQKPDVIVLDISFPPDVGSSGLQWDGFNIMQWMHRFQEAATIPVIIISSGDPIKFREKSLAAGAVAYFQKPIKNEEFLMTLRRVLGQSASNSPITPAA